MKRILVVEDEPELRKVLAMELEASGYEVFVAGDGEEGFEVAQEVLPDLIITDVLMPKMDGNQLLKKMRATFFGRRIPFMVLTARGKMRDYFEAVDVNAFVEKPFEADDLLAKIESILSQPSPYSPGRPSSGPLIKRKRVLVLENELWLRNYLNTIFQEYGYDIKLVQSVGQCLEEAVSFYPDIIIFKYLMESMNANRLVSLIREMPHLKKTPILVYSNTVMGGERELVLTAGATDFIAEANGIRLLKKTNEILEI